MERLTTRNIAGVAVYKNPFECEQCRDTIWRLTDYGNGSPTEKLAAYQDAEEQGLLLRLPCKVGSTLYRVYKKPTKCTAYGEYKDNYACQGCEKECDSSYVWAIYKYKADIKTIVCLSDEIGKTVFLARAEAGQKLKEMNTNNGITE